MYRVTRVALVAALVCAVAGSRGQPRQTLRVTDFRQGSRLRGHLGRLRGSAQARALATLSHLRGSPTTDDSLDVDQDGAVLVVDTPAPVGSTRTRLRARRQALAPIGQVDERNLPILHSKPSSTKKIFLNFQVSAPPKTLAPSPCGR